MFLLFSSDALCFCLSSGELFGLEALSLQALCFCFSAAMRSCSALRGVVAFLLFRQRCAVLLLEQQRVVRPRGAQLPGVVLLLFCSDALLFGLESPGVVALLLFQQRCAVLLLEQRRVVRPRGAQLAGVVLLLSAAMRSCSALRARSRCVSAFQQRCAVLLLSGGELFCLEALSFRRCASAFSAAMRSCSALRARSRCVSAFSAAMRCASA